MKINKEGKRKLKASFANTALILSIFVILFPLTMPNVSAGGGDIIYVDINNTDPPWDGTQANPFQYIDDAVDHAAEEHNGNVTVRVYAGTYEELVTIGSGDWDTLTLQGNGSSDTIVQPPPGTPGTVITISAPWVNVTGFT